MVSGNIVRNLTGTGPYPAEAAAASASASPSKPTPRSPATLSTARRVVGMPLGWGPYLRDVAATGNVIRRAPVGIAVSVVEGAGAAVINNNLISGATSGAIVGMRWADEVSGDLARSGAEAFPQLMIERNAAT